MNKSESKYFNTARRMDEALISLLQKKDFEYITIKEICDVAEVNRSTFYLHYENTLDLLAETIDLVNDKFFSTFEGEKLSIADCQNEDLFLITDKYLLPYLDFIKENRRVFGVIHKQMSLFGAEKTYDKLFKNVFSPILSKFGVEKDKHEYIMSFYRYGCIAIILKWIDGNCVDSKEMIIDIFKKCIKTPNEE